MTRRGAYPGSFDPPTVAHLAIAAAALDAHRLDRVDLIVSRVALAKEHVAIPRLEDRLAVLADSVAEHTWLALVVSDAQLVVDLAVGYDVVILGADKWAQLHDVSFYGSDPARRDAAIAALPTAAIAPRAGVDVPADLLLAVPAGTDAVSSTRARAGERALMLPAARTFDEATGAWTDAERYRRWVTDS